MLVVSLPWLESLAACVLHCNTLFLPVIFNNVMLFSLQDCLTTMLDETIPLTTIEWEEWGNPADPKFYE
jgi:protease II